MIIDIMTSEAKVLLDVERPTPCCLTLEIDEALELGQRLIAAAIAAQRSVSEPPDEFLH